MSLGDLRKEAKNHNLDDTGTKKVLINRLEQHAALHIFPGFLPEIKERLAKVDTSKIPPPMHSAILRIPEALLAHSKNSPSDKASVAQQFQAVYDGASRIRTSLSITKKPKSIITSTPQEAIAAFFESVTIITIASGVTSKFSLAWATEKATSLESICDELSVAGPSPPQRDDAQLFSQFQAAQKSGTLPQFIAQLGAQGGGADGSSAGTQASAAQSSTASARASRILILEPIIKAAVVAALALPQFSISGAGSSNLRSFDDERMIASALVKGFGSPERLSTGTPATHHEPRIVLRMALVEMIMEACLEMNANDDTMSLLPSYLLGCADIAVGDTMTSTRACSWRAFVTHSVVGGTGTTIMSPLSQALETFHKASWFSASPTTGSPSPAITVPDSTPAKGSAAARHPTQPRGPSLAGEVTLTGGDVGKDHRKMVSKLATLPFMACGNKLLAGDLDSDDGPKLLAAHSILSRNTTMGANVVDLQTFAFQGQTGSVSLELLRASTTSMASRHAQAAIIAAACEASAADVISSANQSFVLNAMAQGIVERKLNIGIGHNSANKTFFADSSRSNSFPAKVSAFPCWFREVIEEPTNTTCAKVTLGMSASATTPPSGSVLPCTEFVNTVGEAIYSTLQELADRFPDAPVQWLLSLLFAAFFLEGLLHLRMHPALENAIAPLACIVANAHSPADWPHWFNYHSTRVSIVPPGWPYLQQQATPSPVTRHHVSEESAAAAEAPPETAPLLQAPWCVRCPDEKREEGICPFCGPPYEHDLPSCEKYTRWLQAGGNKLPGARRFTVGRTYTETKSHKSKN